MPANLFFELDKEKQKKIIDTGITEFARYGYSESSTNRMVKEAGISKGSLFKYFQNKEDFYFYILDVVAQELVTGLEKETALLPSELFERIIRYSELEFTWYMEHPEKYQLIVTAFAKSNTEIYQKTEARYGLKGQDIYYKLMDSIDTKQLKWEKQKTVDILKWFLKGFNEDFISRVGQFNKAEINRIKNEYVKELGEYMEVLKEGLIC